MFGIFKLLFLAFGIFIGMLIAPYYGGCDGSFLQGIRDSLKSGSEKVSELLTIQPALADTKSPVIKPKLNTMRDVGPLPWVPTNNEKHASSVSGLNTQFGVLSPCVEGEPYCVYYTKAVLDSSFILMIESPIPTKVASIIGITLKKDYVCGTRLKSFKPVLAKKGITTGKIAFMLNKKNKKVAANWNLEVRDLLSMGLDIGSDTITKWDRLHDKLLSLHPISGKYTAKVAHPAGDIYMAKIEALAFKFFVEYEATCD